MEGPVLRTKLHIPKPRSGTVGRPRLVHKLNEVSDRKLILISAPAGFGKTTLLAEWIASLKAAPDKPRRTMGDSATSLEGRSTFPQAPLQVEVAWISLDEGDNDPARLLAHLVTAIRPIDPHFGLGALEAIQAPRPPPLENSLAVLINQLQALTEPDQTTALRLILVLDDYHTITSQSVHDALGAFLDHLPENVQLVIASRSDPLFPLARLRARRQLAELRLEDLRFSEEESSGFLNRSMGLELPAEDVAILTSRTEGWIAGLQLAAIALQAAAQNKLERSRFVQAFTGTDRYIMDYLLEEVLQRQPAAVQRFMLQTSILNRLSGPLCDTVVGQVGDWRPETGDALQAPFSSSGSQALLEYLESSNLYLFALDHEREWFRYHQLFADLLQKRLKQWRPDLAPVLHGRASAWYEDQGDVSRAIDHSLLGGDHERAAALIERTAEATLMRSEIVTFLNWIEALPKGSVASRPRLCAYYAGALLLTGRSLEEVEARLREAESAGDAVAGEVAAFRAMVATMRADAHQARRLAEQALDVLPEESLFLRTTMANNLGVAHVMRGNIDAAFKAFEEAAQLAEKSGNLMSAVSSLSNMAGMSLSQGRLHQAAALNKRALELARDDQGRLLPIAGKPLLGLAEISREWNDLEGATRQIEEGVELVKRYSGMAAILGLITRAYVERAQGDLTGAEAAMDQAAVLAARFDATEMDDVIVAAYRARIWIAQGRLEAAERWARERNLEHGSAGDAGSEKAAFYDMREVEYGTLARLRHAQGRPEEALDLIEPLLAAAERLGRIRRIIELQNLKAVVLQELGHDDLALEALRTSFSLAQPEGCVQAYVIEGQPMARLLYRAVSQKLEPDYAGRLLAAFPATEPLSGVLDAALIEPLSARELEVLRLIANGLSNREIAESLVISLSTVKGHTANIYSKLAVSSRTQAVARARTLGILDSP